MFVLLIAIHETFVPRKSDLDGEFRASTEASCRSSQKWNVYSGLKYLFEAPPDWVTGTPTKNLAKSVHPLRASIIMLAIALAGTLVRTGDQGRAAAPGRWHCGSAAGN